MASPVVLDAPRTLTAPDPTTDPHTRRLVEAAAAAAYARGKADGAAEAAAALDAVATRLQQAVAAAGEHVASGLAQQRAEIAAEVAQLALAAATAVLGHEPSDGGHALVDRVRAALERIDDEDLCVHVAPTEAALVSAAVADLPSVTVNPDRELSPGDARIAGRWTQADLSRATRLAAVREALGGPA